MESSQTDTLAQMMEGMEVEAPRSRLFLTLVYGWKEGRKEGWMDGRKEKSEKQITLGLDDEQEIICFLS